MDIEIWQAISAGFYRSLLQMLEVIVLINIICISAGFVIYLVGVVWLCFADRRRHASRRRKPAPPQPNEDDLSALQAALEDGLDNILANGLGRSAHRRRNRTQIKPSSICSDTRKGG